MESRARARLGSLALLTFLFGLTTFLMFTIWDRFEPAWFYTTLGVFVALVVAVLFALRGSGETVEEPAELASSEPVEEVARPAFPVSEPTIEVREIPSARPWAPPAATGYQFRGFTLYERTTGRGRTQKTVRFWNRKKKVAEGRPIELPSGFEAVWNPKKRQPALQQIKSEPLRPPAWPSGPVAVTPFAKKRCGAMTRWGDLCEKAARPGSPFCQEHRNWKPGKFQPRLQIVQDGQKRTGTREFRPGRSRIVVKTDKPKAVEVRVGRPRVEVKADRREARAFTVAVPQFVVKTARPKAERLRLRGRPVDVKVTVAKPRREPLHVRIGKPNIVVKTPGKAHDPGAFELNWENNMRVVVGRGPRKRSRPFQPHKPRFAVHRDTKKRSLLGLAPLALPRARGATGGPKRKSR